MEQDYVIVTDSTANLPVHMISENGIRVLPLSYYVDGQKYQGYLQGENIDLSSFYARMREKKEITTSPVSMAAAKELFESLLQDGKDIFYIAFSSSLSETFFTVSMVLEKLKLKYPDRKLYAVDTLAAALGEGLLVHYCIENRKNGMSIDDNANWLLHHRLKLCHWFTVDDLFFLKRGGRISAATAFVGTTLNIKPIMHVDNDGKLVQVSMVQGRKKSLDTLVEHMKNSVLEPENQVIYVSHGDCPEDAEYVAKLVKERFPVKEVMTGILDPVIGAHSGPGTIALFFLGQER
ncbi:MAG: DegV family protein [Clostridiaceae bacterium]|nr:DegV family protein [Clostridiaceae bacterium]